MSRARGFTLIELMVVMLLIVLLFAVWGVLHSWAYDRLTLPEMNARGQTVATYE